MRFGSIRFLVEFKMDYVGHHAPGRAPNPGHKTSMAHGGRNRHAGHSVAMFRDKFWLSFAIPVAAGLFARQGLDLPMSVGAVAMSLSIIIVAANAQLLRRLRLQRRAF